MSEFNLGLAQPVFGGTQVQPSQPNRKNAGNILSLRESSIPGIGIWEVFFNAAGPLGHMTFEMSQGDNGPIPVQSSTLDHRFPGSLPLPSLTTTQDMGIALNSYDRISSIYKFGSFAIAYGNDANDALWVETSNTNPTMVERTFSPPSQITGLYPVVQNGVEYIAMTFVSDPIKLISDLGTTPTVAATMHTDTDNSFGMITTPLPHPNGGFYNLINADGEIMTLATSDATNTQPTSVLTGIPNGGGALGVKAPIGWPLSAWWQIPDVSTGGIMLARLAAKPSSLVRTNLEGSDYQAIKPPYPDMYAIAEWRDGFVMSLANNALPHSVYYWNGQTFEHLRFATERPGAAQLGSTFVDLRVYGFYVRGDDLFVEVYFGTASGTTTRHIEWYDPLSREFYQVTGDIDDGIGTAMDTARSVGSLPVSPLTGFAHTIQEYGNGDNNVFHRSFLGPSITNPFYMLGSGGLGPSAGTAHGFEGSGVTTWAKIRMIGIAQYPKIATEIIGLFGWRDGNKDSTIKIDVAEMGLSHPYEPSFSSTGSTATFTETDRIERTRKFLPANSGNHFLDLQVRETITQGTDTGDTPNGLPFIVRGVFYTDTSKVGTIPPEMKEDSWG